MVTDGSKPGERYSINNNAAAFIMAVSAERGAPVVKAILIDRENGLASWTVQERTISETEFFACE